jgi:hypothetical protein
MLTLAIVLLSGLCLVFMLVLVYARHEYNVLAADYVEMSKRMNETEADLQDVKEELDELENLIDTEHGPNASIDERSAKAFH